MNELNYLISVCDTDERGLIEDMIFSAAEYVKAVVIMETTANNIAGRESEELREKTQATDSARSSVHNGFISSVNIVNRICASHNCPPVYTGSTERREYGNFALKLVIEIYTKRR